MQQSHVILSNALVIWATRILLLVPQVVLVPYLIRTIGEAGYGVYALIWSLLMGIDRLESSLQSGVVKYSAAFLAEKRIESVNRVVSSSFVYSVLLAVLASAGILTAAFVSGTENELGVSLFIVGILVLLIIPLTPYTAIIQAKQRYYVGVLAQTLSKYLSLGAIFVWFTLVNPSVEALIVIMAGMLLVSKAVQIPVAHLFVPSLKNRPELFDRSIFRLILAFGGMTVLVAVCGIANTTGIRWLMGWLISTSFVAHLSIMLMPGILLSQIVLAMTITVMPATSAYEATGNERMLQQLLVRSMRYTTIIVLAGLLVAVFLVKDVLRLWVGPNYIFLAPYALAIFAGEAFLLATSSAHHMLKGLGRLRITIVIATLGKVVIPIALLLVVYLVSGNPYLAVTVGLVSGNIISAVLNIGFAVLAVHTSLRDALFRVFGQPLIAGAIAGAPAFLLSAYGAIHAFTARMGIATAATVGFLAQMYFVFATPAERRQAAEMLQAAWRRVRGIVRNMPALKSLRV